MSKKDTVKVLNNLIKTSEDGKKGFAEASEESTKVELKTMFKQRSIDCDTAAIELQRLVGSLGGTPEDRGTIVGAIERGWAKVKSATGDPNIAMLEVVECEEDNAKAKYAMALSAILPTQIRTVVQRQYDGAVRNHNLIRDLRNTYKKAAKAVVTN